jgi:hypothetical protein
MKCVDDKENRSSGSGGALLLLDLNSVPAGHCAVLLQEADAAATAAKEKVGTPLSASSPLPSAVVGGSIGGSRSGEEPKFFDLFGVLASVKFGLASGGFGLNGKFLAPLRNLNKTLDSGSDTEALDAMLSELLMLGEATTTTKTTPTSDTHAHLALVRAALQARSALGQALKALRRYHEAEWHLWRGLCLASMVQRLATNKHNKSKNQGQQGMSSSSGGFSKQDGPALLEVAQLSVGMAQMLTGCYQPKSGMKTKEAG